MKKHVVLKVAALAFIAAVPLLGKKTEETTHQSFSTASYQRVVVENTNGWIKTSVSEDNDISVTFTRWANHPAGKKVDLGEIEVKVKENTADNTLEITIELPAKHANNVSFGCDIEIKLPENLYVDLSTVNGAISATGHQAGCMLETSNGGIEILETSGELEFTTSNGAVKIENHSGNVSGATSNGVITAEVKMPVESGVCKLETVNGTLSVSVPRTTGAECTMSTVVGAIIIDGEKTQVIAGGPHVVKKTLGDGSGTIELSTVNGVISLERE